MNGVNHIRRITDPMGKHRCQPSEDRRTSPARHMAAHTLVQMLFAQGVRVEPGVWPAYVECTRCGGNHILSKCNWPLEKQ